MALNTNFTAGQILTATQTNNFPRGLVSVTTATTDSANISSETVRHTSPAFTAVANRYYKISYYEPALQYVSGTVNSIDVRIRLTNVSGTQFQLSNPRMNNTSGVPAFCSVVTTLTAGSTVFVATLQPTGGGIIKSFADATARSQLIIEDLGST